MANFFDFQDHSAFEPTSYKLDLAPSACDTTAPAPEITYTSGHWTDHQNILLQDDQNTTLLWDCNFFSDFGSNSNTYENSTYGLLNGSHHELYGQQERDEHYRKQNQNFDALNGNSAGGNGSNPLGTPLNQICYGMVCRLNYFHTIFFH